MEEKSIFISGGATGIGRAVALRFLDEGWTVGCYDINESALTQLQQEYPAIVTGVLDVTNAESWDHALADFTVHTGGRLDVLDANAGVIGDGPITEQSPEIIERQHAVNCTGVVLGARAAHRYLGDTPGSHMVTMGSASAIWGQPGIAPYSATKFYVRGLTQALSLEWRKDKVRCVTVMPLWAKTSLSSVTATSVRRLGVRITPEQVADAVWRSVHPSNRVQRARMEYSVSRLDLALRYAEKFAPNVVARALTRVLAG